MSYVKADMIEVRIILGTQPTNPILFCGKISLTTFEVIEHFKDFNLLYRSLG